MNAGNAVKIRKTSLESQRTLGMCFVPLGVNLAANIDGMDAAFISATVLAVKPDQKRRMVELREV